MSAPNHARLRDLRPGAEVCGYNYAQGIVGPIHVDTVLVEVLRVKRVTL